MRMKLNINAYYRLARLDKPAGAWLLLLPCWWGLALAGSFDFFYYALFTIGAFTMRAAGCVINDIADREYDSQVERTRTRPLASGEISLVSALIFLGILLLLGLVILTQLPTFAIIIGLGSVPLFVIYPFMKRITYWPQAFLGLTFNIGVLIAFATIQRDISFSAVILYLAGIMWTLGYDTIYALQDMADDMRIGVKSTAIRFGGQIKIYVAAFYAMTLILFATAVNFQNGFGLPSFSVFILAACHFTWQIRRLKPASPHNWMALFRSNIYAGLILLVCLLLSATGN